MSLIHVPFCGLNRCRTMNRLREIDIDMLWNEYMDLLNQGDEIHILNFFENMLPVLEGREEFKLYTDAYAKLLSYFIDRGKIAQLLKYGVELIDKSKKLEVLKTFHWYYMVIATIDYLMEDLSESKLSLESARRICERDKDKEGIVRVIDNLAEINILEEDYQEAIANLLDARKMIINDPTWSMTAKLYNTSVLAKAYIKSGDYKRGKVYLDELDSVQESYKFPIHLYETYYGYAEYYLGIGDENRALEYFKRTIDVVVHNQFEFRSDQLFEIYSELLYRRGLHQEAYNNLIKISKFYENEKIKTLMNLMNHHKLVEEIFVFEYEIKRIRLALHGYKFFDPL